MILFFSVTPGIAADFEIHGFVQGNYTARTTGEEPPGPEGGDFLLGEERFRIELTSQEKQAAAVIKIDLIHDTVIGEGDHELREAYVDYRSGWFDARIGRQILTWGAGDLLFINDVYPKDWEAFFSGRPVEYLKVGVDGIKLNGYSDLLNAEVVVVPFFEPDRLPTSDRFLLFDPFPEFITRTKTEPESGFQNTELAVRVYRYIGSWDAALYAYKGYWRQPGIHSTGTTTAELSYPRLAAYGASTQAGILEGVVSLEAGYYDSRDDRGGNDPSIPNSQTRYLIGYQRQIWSDFTVGFQYYAEWMRHHSAYRASLSSGFPEQDRLRHLVTMRLTQMLRYQTVRLSFFIFYSSSDGDYYLIPEVRYSFTDELWATIGANIFDGRDDTTMFGQLDKNDNVYLAVRYEF
jgi:hypothetical protein